jgi:hypothetical protein
MNMHETGVESMQLYTRILVSLVAVAVLAMLGGCTRNVTAETQFGFVPWTGKCLKTEQPLFLCSGSGYASFSLEKPGFGLPSSVAVYEADPSNVQAAPIIAVIPAGIEIRAEKMLCDELNSSYPYHAVGQILGGRYKGKRVEITDLFVLPMRPPLTWILKPGYLAPCSETDRGR